MVEFTKLKTKSLNARVNKARYMNSHGIRAGKLKENSVLISRVRIVLIKSKEELVKSVKHEPCGFINRLHQMDKQKKFKYPCAVFIIYDDIELPPVYTIWYNNLDQHFMFDNRFEKDFALISKAKSEKKLSKAVTEMLSKIQAAYFTIFRMLNFKDGGVTLIDSPDLYIDEDKTRLFLNVSCV
jgi:hypothetical protein